MKSVLAQRSMLLIGLFALLFATAAQSQSEQIPVTWAKDGVDWSQYDKIYLKPLDISEIKMVRPPWAEDDPKEWNFDSANPDMVQAVFRDSIKSALEAGEGYKVVHGPGDGVLELKVEILSIMPYVRPGKESSDGYQLTTLGSGEMTSRVELRDSNNRELLLLAEGTSIVGTEYKDFNARNNLANLVGKFESFGQRLRAAMDKAHGK